MAEPISIEDAETYLRASDPDELGLIGSLITTAREAVEDYTGLILTRRTVVETAPALSRWIDLSAWPVVSIDSIAYLDAAGTSQPLTLGSWRASLAARPVRLLPVRCGWGVSGGYALDAVLPVTITMTAGYATPDAVPETFKQAIRMLVAHYYERRGGEDVGKVDEMPPTVVGLLRRKRTRRV